MQLGCSSVHSFHVCNEESALKKSMTDIKAEQSTSCRGVLCISHILNHILKSKL